MAGLQDMAHLPGSGLFPWRSRPPPMGQGPRPACAPAPALRCMPRPPRSPRLPACLRPGDLTAAPPSHRRLSGASPLRAEGVRESQGLQLQPQHGLFEVRRLPHHRPFLVAAPTPRANVHWRMWCAGHWRPVMRNELSPAGPRQGNGRPGRGSWPR